MFKGRNWALVAGAFLCLAGTSGCGNTLLSVLAVPVPMPAWVTERMEDQICWDKDFKTPIMPPIRPGFPPPTCEDPPDEAMVLRAMPRVARGVPYIYEEFRDNIQIVTELLVDRIDPPRFYPLIGPAQLHHCHWKCIVYYTETIESSYPFPYRCKRPRIEVIYVDRDHLHLCAGDDPRTLQSMTRDTLGP